MNVYVFNVRTIMVDYNPSEKVTKILIDDLSDFKLSAAYLAYSKAWVENLDEKIRLVLNNVMIALIENKESYSTFYYEINRYGKDGSNEYSSRERIVGVKKRAYRKNEAKRRRILRHKN
jgi:hypothetical protein